VVELCHLVQALEVSFVFFDNFVKLCEEKGVRPSRALTDAGVPKSAYSYWRTEASSGNDAKPTNQNAVKLAQYFGVTVDYLLTGDQKENPSSRKVKSMQHWSGLEKSLNLCQRNSVKR
jgi:transcriptional regulator with XRE-family HTH domain